MKHKGSVSQINIERKKIMVALYKKAKRISVWPTKQSRLYELAASLPVPQFYISSDAAINYVRDRFYHGIIKKFSYERKQILYDALYEKFIELQRKDQYKNMSVSKIVEIALMHPAPCVGVQPKWFEIAGIGRQKKYTKRKKHTKTSTPHE